MSTKIKYNGAEIATVEAGETKILECSGKKMVSNVAVEMADSPLPIEVSTEVKMTTLLESGEVGGVYKYTGESTETYENGAFYVLEDYGAELLGTWTLKPQNFDMSMVTSTGVIREINISGVSVDGTSIANYDTIGIKQSQFAIFQLSNETGLSFTVEYPIIRNLRTNAVLSNSADNQWTTYSTFTINEVSSTDTATISTVLAFLQANATKQ